MFVNLIIGFFSAVLKCVQRGDKISRPNGTFSRGIHSRSHGTLEDLIEKLGIHHSAINPVKYYINVVNLWFYHLL